jgi:glutamate-5-semialdehyde dehydrogenase
MVSIGEEIAKIAKRAKEASRILANITTEVKNRALSAMADSLEENVSSILQENARDVESAKSSNLSNAFIDRLTLSPKRIKSMADGLREIVSLPDPIGEVLFMRRRPNGLQVGKVRVPLGVVGIIYESRPNVTSDATGLCLKSGNAVILRGGREAINSNRIISSILMEAGKRCGVPDGAISFIKITDRVAITELVRQDEYVDVIIPRGSQEMIQSIKQEATVPVISHGPGNCHTYVDQSANLEMAEDVVFNAKVQRPGVCNATEKLLVHKDVAQEFIPRIVKRLKEAGVEIRACPKTLDISPELFEATEEDWGKEYLDLIIGIKIVDDIDEAIAHINKYGSNHTEAIITSSYSEAKKFLQDVDAAALFVNASTRFTDGGEFGLGAEIGISTQKLHARGPMGLVELTSTKFIILGDGQIRG